MGALQGVAKTCDQPLTSDTRRSLELALRYFREAAPKHTADEEESLFPVLRNMDDADVKQALEKIEGLEVDHRWAEPLHEKVDAIGNEYLSKGELTPNEAEEFRTAITQLAEMYARHIEVEDRDVFPVAAKKLSAEQKHKIGLEMANRRSVKLTTNL